MADQNRASSPKPFDADFLFEQARGYLAFGEQISKLAEQFRDDAPKETDWGAVLRQNFARFKTAIAESANGPNADPDLARLWTQTLDVWQQTAASLGVVAPKSGNAESWQSYQRVQGQYLGLLRRSAEACCGDLPKRR